MTEPLFAATDSVSTLGIIDGGLLAACGTMITVLWRRTVALEERSRNDSIAAIKAINDTTAALKDVVKTIERFQSDVLAEVRRK